MVGLFGLLVYFVIGIAVAAVERRGNESRELIAIATAGAVAGAFAGAKLGLYVAFGELPGLICAVAGAVAVVRIYRSRFVGMTTRAAAPAAESEPLPAPSGYGAAVPPRAESIAPSQSLFAAFARRSGGALSAHSRPRRQGLLVI